MYTTNSVLDLEPRLIASVANMTKCMGKLHNIIFSVASEISLGINANEKSVLLSANSENAHDPSISQSQVFKPVIKR